MPRHQTLHKEIKSIILNLRKRLEVKKVVIGPYENCRHRYTPGTLKVMGEINSGFKLNGYDGSGVYVFYLYLNDENEREVVREIIENKK